MLQTNFPDTSSGQQNAAFSYLVLRLTYTQGLIPELGRCFPDCFLYEAVCGRLRLLGLFLLDNFASETEKKTQ